MIKYILKRLLQSLLTLFIIATVVFFLMRLMPEEGYFGEEYDKMDEQQIEAALTAMGPERTGNPRSGRPRHCSPAIPSGQQLRHCARRHY